MLRAAFIRPERIFICLALLQSVIYWLTTDPFTKYYHQTERFLHVAYLAHVTTGGEPGTLPFSYIAFAAQKNPDKLADVYGEAGKKWVASTGDYNIAEGRNDVVSFQTDQNPAAYSFISYLPQLSMFILGELVEFMPATSLLASQIANIAVTLGITYLAIRLWPFLKWQIVAFMLFPAMVMQRMNMMPDSLTAALCLYLIGYVLSVRVNTIRMTGYGILLLAAIAVMIGQCKSVYVPIVLIAALLPVSAFSRRWTYIATIAGLFALACFSSWCWSYYIFEHYRDSHHITWDLNILEERKAELMAYPWQYVAHLLDMFTEPQTYRLWVANQVFWYSYDLHEWLFMSYIACMLSCLIEPATGLDRKTRFIAIGLFFGMLILLVTVMKMVVPFAELFGFSGVKWVIQGRYLFPLMPLAWLGYAGLVKGANNLLMPVRVSIIAFPVVFTALSFQLI